MGKSGRGARIEGKSVKVAQFSTSSFKRGRVVETWPESWKVYRDRKMVKVVLRYVREPMSGNGVYHDFIFLHCHFEKEPGSEYEGMIFYIKAEKTYDQCGDEKPIVAKPDETLLEKVGRLYKESCVRGEIVIGIKEERPFPEVEQAWVKKFDSVEFKDCGKITPRELVAVLRNHPKRYFLLHYNCWWYAVSMVEDLFKKFIDHNDTTKEKKKDLEKKLAKVSKEFPELPSSKLKPALYIIGAVSVVGFLVTEAAQLLVKRPTDSIIGNCLMALLQATPRGLYRGLYWPLFCAKTRSVKAVYKALKWFDRFGLECFMDPALIGRIVTILSSQVLVPAAQFAVIAGLAVALIYISFEFCKLYYANKAREQKGCDDSVQMGGYNLV